MARFPFRSWHKRSLAAILGLALAAPLASAPALAHDWDHDRDLRGRREVHRDRDDWRRPVVAPAPVYAAPAYYAPPTPAYGYGYSCGNGAAVGGLAGAAAGGLIGSQLGHRSDNVAATLIGIIGGAAVGASIGAAADQCR